MTRWIIVCFIISLLSGCHHAPENTVTQISTIDALLAGHYDGSITLKTLSRYGDFGIGTFDKLDGEMIVSDGKIYQVRADGKVVHPDQSLKTPFASIITFNADTTLLLDTETDFQNLQQIIDIAAPDNNSFYAVRIKGDFSQIRTRSVPPQSKPYPPLVDVTKNQPTFIYEMVSGTLLGFRSPPFVKGIGVPGYHLHFLSNDRKKGGHVLNCLLTRGIIELDICHRFTLILPEKNKEFSALDLKKDRSAELERVEVDDG